MEAKIEEWVKGLGKVQWTTIRRRIEDHLRKDDEFLKMVAFFVQHEIKMTPKPNGDTN